MRAAVLWTGGKDSALALYKAQMAGHEIVSLLTFMPKDADFLAHPVSFMKYQAQAMAIPHIEAIVDAPVEDGYERAIRSFKDRYGVEVLITGDIAEVNGMPNWIRQRCEGNDIEVLTPLWGGERDKFFKELIYLGFKVVISCVKNGSLGEEWLGRELNDASLKDLCGIRAKTGLDICGEQGEYHTLVLDAPFFRKALIIGNYSKHANDWVMYINPQNIKFSVKA